jgi:16S rRNA (cytidine1402-2'-O)-methyltransferase
MTHTTPGTLYLIPALLGGEDAALIPPATRSVVHRLDRFVVENAKSARQFLKLLGHPLPLQQIEMQELNEHTPASALPALLQPLLAGKDVGLLSEAGCPAVADPGANLVALAHTHHIRVVPLVGPSSILLALMASGLNGQRFAFHGYLPANPQERERKIAELEKESKARDMTQIFIEAPYRNQQLLESLLKSCKPGTLLCIATDLTLASETVATRRIADWRGALPEIHKRPTLFLLKG